METKQNTPDVQKEIGDLLKSQAKSERPKACLFNLIIYSEEPQRTECLREMMKMIIAQFPCRMIYIEASQNSKDNDLQVQTASGKNFDANSIASDQIFIKASAGDQ